LVTVLNMPLFPSTLVINVMNDGVVGTFSFQLQPNTDVDNDGMPNDYEVRNGFNPNFAGDAAQDADFDGLTNLQEFQGRTAPRDPDTDRDGISAALMIRMGRARSSQGPILNRCSLKLCRRRVSSPALLLMRHFSKAKP
jgi:hypothetical protein